jgi:hypothetical protein
MAGSKNNILRITKAAVDGLQPGQTVWDTDLQGFGVRGHLRHKSYILKLYANGRQKWITIGRHPNTTFRFLHTMQQLSMTYREISDFRVENVDLERGSLDHLVSYCMKGVSQMPFSYFAKHDMWQVFPTGARRWRYQDWKQD